jgi:hypothetical protein
MRERPFCRNEIAQVTQVLEDVGAGEGNRTLVISLEGPRSASLINGFSDNLARFAPLAHKWNSRLSEWVGWPFALPHPSPP